MDGIILIDKEPNRTSFSAVRRVKGLLNIKKVGHAGTLDPFATGLLVLLLGQGTKISSWLMNETKAYQASIRLGIETDTFDSTGKITQVKPVPLLDRQTVERGLDFFRGEIDQKPPAFSALKYQGTRAYKLARRGIAFDLKERKVRISQLELLEVNPPRMTLRISCSSGTYVRSLAADVGKRLGTVGYLESLRRLCSGYYRAEDAYRFTESRETDRLQLQERVIPLYQSLPGLKVISLDKRLAVKIRNGYKPALDEVMGRVDYPEKLTGYLQFICGPDLVAIARIGWPEEGPDGKGKLKVVRVFAAQGCWEK